MSTCLHCGAETSNGLALCEMSQELAAKCLEFVPVYFRNLARWRPGRAGSRPVPGSREPQGAFAVARESSGDRISTVLNEVGNDLSTWARSLMDDRGVQAPDCDDEITQVAAVCALLARNLTSVATLEWAGEFVRTLRRHEVRLRELTEASVPGWYAGACQRKVGMETPEHDGKCGVPTYVVPGLTWVTCAGCGSTTYARDHLETVVDEARVWIARPRGIAEALVALLDTEESVPRLYDRIRQWAKREEIRPLRYTTRDHIWSDEAQALVVADVETGHARYQLGEVLDRVLTDGATRVVDETSARAV